MIHFDMGLLSTCSETIVTFGMANKMDNMQEISMPEDLILPNLEDFSYIGGCESISSPQFRIDFVRQTPNLLLLIIGGVVMTEVPGYVKDMSNLEDLRLSCGEIPEFQLVDICPGTNMMTGIQANRLTTISGDNLFLPDASKFCKVSLNANYISEIADDAFGPLLTQPGGYLPLLISQTTDSPHLMKALSDISLISAITNILMKR